MNNRQRMYETNGKVRFYLNWYGYKDIHFFPHTRFSKDVHFKDLEFDGCASLGKQFVLFQTKTNCKPSKQQLEQMKKANEESFIIILWFNQIYIKGNTKKRNLEVYMNGVQV